MDSLASNVRKSTLDLINDCDRSEPSLEPSKDVSDPHRRIHPNTDTTSFYRLQLSSHPGATLGLILPSTIFSFGSTLSRAAWAIDNTARTLTLSAPTLRARNEHIKDALLVAQHHNAFSVLQSWNAADTETLPVFMPGRKREHVLDIPRAAAPLFGIVAWGVQLIAYREDEERLMVWIARRSMGKRSFPGMLDAIGGALGTGESVLKGLIREAGEEAKFGVDLMRKARACGTISYVYVTDEKRGGEIGLVCPEVQFVYELCIGEETVPFPADGEVEQFESVHVEELRGRLERGDFRPASACVMIDFLVRHGVLTAENEENYEEVTQRLHRLIDLTM